jgi:hypothetical protein
MVLIMDTKHLRKSSSANAQIQFHIRSNLLRNTSQKGLTDFRLIRWVYHYNEFKQKEKTMKKRMQRLWWGLITVLLLSPSLALAAGGGGAAPIVLVADTRKLDGIMLWWANLYNESHLYFMILTIIIIPLTGVVFGVIADIIMSWIGIDLKNRELAEH